MLSQNQRQTFAGWTTGWSAIVLCVVSGCLLHEGVSFGDFHGAPPQGFQNLVLLCPLGVPEAWLHGSCTFSHGSATVNL